MVATDGGDGFYEVTDGGDGGDWRKTFTLPSVFSEETRVRDIHPQVLDNFFVLNGSPNGVHMLFFARMYKVLRYNSTAVA